MMNEPISMIMTKDVITISANQTAKDASDILFSKRIHHLPVVDDDQKLIGIITSYDLIKKCKVSDELSNVSITDIMTTKMATLEPTNKIGAAAQVFLENLFHGLPITLEDKTLVGIITTHDVLKYEFNKAYPNHQINWGNG